MNPGRNVDDRIDRQPAQYDEIPIECVFAHIDEAFAFERTDIEQGGQHGEECCRDQRKDDGGIAEYRPTRECRQDRRIEPESGDEDQMSTARLPPGAA